MIIDVIMKTQAQEVNQGFVIYMNYSRTSQISEKIMIFETELDNDTELLLVDLILTLSDEESVDIIDDRNLHRFI